MSAMTDRRCSGCSGSGGYGVVRANGGVGCGRVLSSSSSSAGRCNGGKTAAAIVRPAAAVMHVRKTWKNAAVMLLAVAAVTTATAAFYFNYAATACCTIAVAGGQSSAPADQAQNAAAYNAAGSDEPNRGLFGSSVARASKMYAVCETQDYRRVSNDLTYCRAALRRRCFRWPSPRPLCRTPRLRACPTRGHRYSCESAWAARAVWKRFFFRR